MSDDRSDEEKAAHAEAVERSCDLADQIIRGMIAGDVDESDAINGCMQAILSMSTMSAETMLRYTVAAKLRSLANLMDGRPESGSVH